MVEKFCLFLTNRMRKENPEIDDERAEIINYGLQLLVGEIPKMLITIGIAYLLGILKLTVIMVILILPFRAFSGGFHLHTHIGCILSTTLFYCGIAKISNFPILRKKERKQKKILSYIIFTLGLILALVIKNNAVCNIIIFGYLVQTLMITPVAYKITKNSYGYKKTSKTFA